MAALLGHVPRNSNQSKQLSGTANSRPRNRWTLRKKSNSQQIGWNKWHYQELYLEESLQSYEFQRRVLISSVTSNGLTKGLFWSRTCTAVDHRVPPGCSYRRAASCAPPTPASAPCSSANSGQSLDLRSPNRPAPFSTRFNFVSTANDVVAPRSFRRFTIPSLA